MIIILIGVGYSLFATGKFMFEYADKLTSTTTKITETDNLTVS